MNLWPELLSPSPVTAIPVTENQFNSAWEWIFKSGKPAMVLTLIRKQSLEFRRQGHEMDLCAQMAAVSLWMKFKPQSPLPTRKTPPAAFKTVLPRRLPKP